MAQPIDLTGGSSKFEPHTGAKRLVIKNLRAPLQKDTEVYYTKIWNEIDSAITSVFKGQPPDQALDPLSRRVEDLCRRGQPGKLSLHLRDRCKSYLEKELLPVIESHAGLGNVDALRAVYQYWTIWNDQSVRSHISLNYGLANEYLHRPSSVPFSATSIAPISSTQKMLSS